MSKIGLLDIFKSDDKVADESKTLPSDILVEPAKEVPQTESAKEEPVKEQPSEPEALPSDVIKSTEEMKEEICRQRQASEPESSEPSSNADASEGEGEGESESGWVDWNVAIDSRFMVADVTNEDGFFGTPAELLPFVFRVFQAVLNDGDNEDKHAALSALKFLTEHYREYPEPAPQPITKSSTANVSASGSISSRGNTIGSTPVTTGGATGARSETFEANSRSESAQPEIKIPESLKEMAQAAEEEKVSHLRLPEPALGFFDENGRVRNYKAWKDAGRPDDWDEEVVWKFGEVLSNLTVPKDVAGDFYDGIKRDPMVDHDFANKAQVALKVWNQKIR